MKYFLLFLFQGGLFFQKLYFLFFIFRRIKYFLLFLFQGGGLFFPFFFLLKGRGVYLFEILFVFIIFKRRRQISSFSFSGVGRGLFIFYSSFAEEEKNISPSCVFFFFYFQKNKIFFSGQNSGLQSLCPQMGVGCQGTITDSTD